ncbi:MAG TPA: shikimate dehydrogenase [Acidobacteriaceae bacterium]|jgi:3-dehydroquinate dehydratase/shikimate dehydrogenase|nr:shikimate dehydrogenase [Acidobacteriaceae bacterium]
MPTSSQVASHLLRSRIGKLCIAIIGNSADEMLEKAAVALKDTTFLEFRLDYLPEPAAALAPIGQFLSDHGGTIAIATCRCKENGGRFNGSSEAALGILLKAASSGFQLVDVELESIERLPPDTMGKLRETGIGVILSFHDFKATGDLDAVYRRMEPFAPDYMKVVPTANSLADNLTLMKFIERTEDRSSASIVGICMGEPGVISRVLGLRAGSAFTFAAATAGDETAPGQITARTLIETYRIEQVDVATKVYGVAGDPIRSSLSPIMLNTAFRRETVNAVYLALQTKDAEDLFKLAREVPIQGLSVTMPLKQAVVPFLERTDPLSTKIGAVNTISRLPDGKFYGFNTDVAGIIVPLERRLSLRDAKILVLGAGGSARAAVFGCRDKGAEVCIYNRTPETAQKLARQAGAKTIKREALAKTSFDVIINATPAGMAGNQTSTLLEPDELNARFVFDLVYNPLETPLLRMARQKGIAVISGVEMFVQQGARQFEIWTGKPAPEDEMLRVVLHALRQGGDTSTPDLTAGSARSATSDSPQPVSHADPEPSVTQPPRPSAPGTPGPSAAQTRPLSRETASTSPRAAALPPKSVSRPAPEKSAPEKKPSATPGKPAPKADVKVDTRSDLKSTPGRKPPAPAPAVPKKVAKVAAAPVKAKSPAKRTR